MSVKGNTMFTITSVCKDDIIEAFAGRDELKDVKLRLVRMTRDEMKDLARKMANDYLTQLYWDSLRILFEDWFLEEQED